MSSNDPFESIGPGSKKPEQADEGPVKGAVKGVRDFYNKKEVKDTVRKAERLFKVAKEVKPHNPFSIAHAVAKTAEVLYEFDKVSQPRALRKFNEFKEHGHVLTEESVTHIFVSLMDPEMMVEVESSISSSEKKHAPTLYRFDLKPGNEGVDAYPVFWYRKGFEFSELICPDSLDKNKVLEHLSGLLWEEHGNQIEMLWGQNREFDFRVKPPHPWRYEGEFGLNLIKRWKRAFEMGMRRFIILHGPPGTGKSTLARQLGVDIGARVLYVPIQTIIDSNSVKYFADTLNVVNPEVVIIDDIDRSSKNLETLLSLFEETENHVPILLATTNHLERLPGAIKRPGRFDEIWKIDPPPKEVRGRVIRYLAGLEDVSLTDSQVKAISDISGSLSLSGAHIREIIRRIRLEGWDEDWESLEFDDLDLTFTENWRPSSYTPEGVSVHDFDDKPSE